MLIPSFASVDSISEFESATTERDSRNPKSAEEKRTIDMEKGRFRTKFISALPSLTNKANTSS
jgi:hypothetical protein